MTRTLTVRLEPETIDGLERLARSTKRSKAFLAGQAVAEFVANQSWQIAAIEEAREQISRGEIVSADDVRAWLRSWGRDDELPPPRRAPASP